MTDPYQIAYLRGGPEEAIKVAAATLAHRRAVKVRGDLITTEQGHSEVAANQLEKTILEDCHSGASLGQLVGGRSAEVAEKLFHQRLINEHLILSDEERQMARLLKVLVIGGLLVTAAIKILIAFQRGRHNVLFLILLAAVGVIAHAKFSLWRTPTGSSVLRDLRTLFARLRTQSRQLASPSQNRNFSFLIAVFGAGALSTTESLFLSGFKPRKEHGWGSGTSCGTSATSCSSSCGSSGCGGGGGCGGCGS